MNETEVDTPAAFRNHSAGSDRCWTCILADAGARWPCGCPCGGNVHVNASEPAQVEPGIVERKLTFWCDGCGDTEGP